MEVHNASFLGHVGITNKHLEPLLRSPIAEFISSLSLLQGAVLFLCLFWGYSSLQVHRRVRVPGAPIHGYWSWFEPTWLLQLRYAKDAHKIIASGYQKVRHSQERCSRAKLLTICSTTRKASLSYCVAKISTLQFFRPSTFQSCERSQMQSLAEERRISWYFIQPAYRHVSHIN
jgi:hypothetical protein